MKHVKTIIPTSKKVSFGSVPDPNIERIEIFREGTDSEQVKVAFIVRRASEEGLYSKLSSGIDSGCSATEGAEVPKISSTNKVTPHKEASIKDPLLEDHKSGGGTHTIAIEGAAMSVVSALKDAFDHFKFPLNRDYLSQIANDLQSTTINPGKSASCIIL